MSESSAAFRHRAHNFYGRTPPRIPNCKTDLDVLIERHRFIRDSDEKNLSWEDALAKKTYDQLFKEYAVCDLSRWKESKVAMRWRTASEVIDGRGHFTCANLRCKHHESKKPVVRRGQKTSQETSSAPRNPSGSFDHQRSFIPLEDHSQEEQEDPQLDSQPQVRLQELQTQFGYTEEGVRKLAEVKLRLCKRCARKMDACSQSKRRAAEIALTSGLASSSKNHAVGQNRSTTPSSSLHAPPTPDQDSPKPRKRSRKS